MNCRAAQTADAVSRGGSSGASSPQARPPALRVIAGLLLATRYPGSSCPALAAPGPSGSAKKPACRRRLLGGGARSV